MFPNYYQGSTYFEAPSPTPHLGNSLIHIDYETYFIAKKTKASESETAKATWWESGGGCPDVNPQRWAPGPIVNQDWVSPLRDANRGRQKPGATIPGCEKSCCAGASGCCKSGCVDVFGGSHGYWLPSPNKWEKCLSRIYSIRINANDFFMNEQHACKKIFFHFFFFKEACPSLIS